MITRSSLLELFVAMEIRVVVARYLVGVDLRFGAI
jgi:hypothetical protein